jgi:hypothetical protein
MNVARRMRLIKQEDNLLAHIIITDPRLFLRTIPREP